MGKRPGVPVLIDSTVHVVKLWIIHFVESVACPMDFFSFVLLLELKDSPIFDIIRLEIT